MKNILILLVLISIPFSAFASGDAAKGKTTYDQACASCHGPKGAGDGPVAAGLPADQKPANLATGTRKVATDDAKLKELIKKGGPAFGLNPLMAPQAHLSDADIDNLIAYIHTLK